MTLLFDTSALSALLSDEDFVVRSIADQGPDRIVIPLATDAELRFGFANCNKAADNLKKYDLFKLRFNAAVVCPDQDTAIVYADIATWARQHGLALSNNDFWIAAISIQHGGVLFTLDNAFKGLPQLRIVVPSRT